MVKASMDETELIAAIKNGIDRFSELVERYQAGLIIHCDRLVGNRDDAEDIAQEAFVRAYVQLERFDPKRARFSTWLYKIATNLAIDYLRKHTRQVIVEDIETIAGATMPVHLEEEERREIRAAVAKLMPPEYCQVIEAYYWEGKSYQQIADEKQVPVNTVRTWIRRAKLQLREKIS
jgi:RNA polymerase sigma-70 factor (ECF subfamily)